MATKLIPMYDRLIIEPFETPSTTASGLHIPDSAKERTLRGKVLAVGPGKQLPDGSLMPLRVTVGDVVVYGKYSGTAGAEVRCDGRTLVVLREEEIFAVESDA